MKIFLRIRENEIVPIDVEPTYSITTLKLKIDYLLSIPPEHQLLVFAGKPIECNELEIKDYGIQDQSTVYLVLRLSGGCNNADGVCTCWKENTESK